ncbi:MAG: hypothetical protein KF724_13405 [Phycisphaeraceae bacterium]|nr:hypothetical protein [Phycisphaeraceae bacterium]
MTGTTCRSHWHRFRFDCSVPIRDCEALLRLASFATEGLCGIGATSAVSYRLVPDLRVVEIDINGHSGCILAAVFRAFVRREYGVGGLIEDRILIPTMESG